MKTPKTTQELFANTDWAMLRTQKLSIMAAINYCEFLGKAKPMADLRNLLDWLDCLQVAAEAEGHLAFDVRVKV